MSCNPYCVFHINVPSTLLLFCSEEETNDSFLLVSSAVMLEDIVPQLTKLSTFMSSIFNVVTIITVEANVGRILLEYFVFFF